MPSESPYPVASEMSLEKSRGLGSVMMGYEWWSSCIKMGRQGSASIRMRKVAQLLFKFREVKVVVKTAFFIVLG